MNIDLVRGVKGWFKPRITDVMDSFPVVDYFYFCGLTEWVIPGPGLETGGCRRRQAIPGCPVSQASHISHQSSDRGEDDLT